MSALPNSALPPQPGATTFFGDVLRLASGTGMAQIIAVVAAPFLTRLYLPEDYGLAALFVSISGILGVIACLRYEMSIVLPKEDRDAVNLVATSILAAMLVAGLCVPVIWFAQDYLLGRLRTPGLANFVWLIPIAVLIHGVHQALRYWSSRARRFTRLSIAAVTGSSTTTSAQFGAAFAGHATGGAMIIAKVGGQTLAVAVLAMQVIRDSGCFFVRHVRWTEIAKGFRRHRKFPIFSSAASLLNALSWQLPVLMLAMFFTPAAVGYYALGFQLLQVPMGLIGGSISQVFFQRAAEARKDGSLPSLVEALFEGLTVVCLFPMLALAIIGQDLFALVFGIRWAEAGVYAQILSVWVYVWFVSSPLSTLFAVFEKQEKGLVLQVIIFTSRLVSLTIGAYTGNVRVTLAMFSLAGVLAYGYLMIRIFKLAGVNIRKPAKTLAKQLVINAPFLLPILLATVFGVESVYLVALATFAGIIYLYSQRGRAAAIINLRASTNE